MPTVRERGMHNASIEAERFVTKVYNTSTAGVEEWIWRGWDVATVALNPELTSDVVAPGNDESGPHIGRVPVPSGGEVFIDLYRCIREAASKCGKKCVEVMDEVRVSESNARHLPSLGCAHRS